MDSIDFGSCLFPFILVMMMIYGVLLHSSDLGHRRAQAANPCTSFTFCLICHTKEEHPIHFCRISSLSSSISEVHFRKHKLNSEPSFCKFFLKWLLMDSWNEQPNNTLTHQQLCYCLLFSMCFQGLMTFYRHNSGIFFQTYRSGESSKMCLRILLYTKALGLRYGRF